MKFTRLIADSGGTKTDWSGVDEDNQQHRFTTESYHPLKVDDEFVDRQLEFWNRYDISECFLHFFGAGCLHEENQQKMRTVFKKIGFSDVLVESDLFAAARVVGNEKGMIAICGTGSVLFKVRHGQLLELRGGLGWEQGDEGGGFYFGKLLLEQLREHGNEYQEIRNVIERWKSIDELYAIWNKPESKGIYSQLSVLLTNYQSHPLIASVHMENVRLFLERYAEGVTSISFVGSYAFHMKNYFNTVCKSENIKISTFVERPMDVLIKMLLL